MVVGLLCVIVALLAIIAFGWQAALCFGVVIGALCGIYVGVSLAGGLGLVIALGAIAVIFYAICCLAEAVFG